MTLASVYVQKVSSSADRAARVGSANIAVGVKAPDTESFMQLEAGHALVALFVRAGQAVGGAFCALFCFVVEEKLRLALGRLY